MLLADQPGRFTSSAGGCGYRRNFGGERIGMCWRNPPAGLPLVFGQRAPQPCFSFWMEGKDVPLGITGAYPSVRHEWLLLRIYPD